MEINKQDILNISFGFLFCILLATMTTTGIEIKNRIDFCSSLNMTPTNIISKGVLCNGSEIIQQEDGYILKPELNLTKLSLGLNGTRII